jgi:AraC-like DNA-binding protein
MGELWQAFVQITASVNALLLGAAIIFSRRLHRTRSRHKLGLALLCYGYLLLSFTARDNLWVPVNWWLVLVDYLVVLFASALFLDYMSSALSRTSISKWYYLPPPLFVVVAMLLGPGFVLGNAINVVVVLQFAYTVLTTRVFVSQCRELANWPRHLPVLLAGLWILHVFQFARMLLPDVGWLFDIVPLAGAAVFLVLTVLVLTDPQALRSLSQVGIAMPVSRDAADTVEAYMRAEKPYLDPQLSAGRLAEAVGLAPRELSRVIANGPDGSFYNFVNRFRVAEAQQLLADPTEARTSAEAIGLMAGFRSRSTFYEAFKRETGVTPARYRSERAGSGAVSG